MASRRGKVVFGAGIVAFGVVVFLLATGYLIERGIPRWVAAGFGALAFPVLPVVWHVVGERRRRTRVAAAKTPPKNALASGDRYLLRAVAVTVVVLGPMFALGGFGVVEAGWRHKAFFLPVHVPTLLDDTADLLVHLPSEAETVVVFRERRPGLVLSMPSRGVAGYRDHQLAIVTSHAPANTDAELLDTIHDKVLASMPWLISDRLAAVEVGDDVFAAATPRWKDAVHSTGGGPSAALRDGLAEAPPDAILALAWVPAEPAAQFGIRSLVGWVTQREKGAEVVVDGRIVLARPDHAKAVREGFEKMRAMSLQMTRAACRDKTKAVTDGAVVRDYGNTITYHLVIDPARFAELALCQSRLED